MLEFMRAGGIGMWFVLLFGGISLGAAIRFALGPDPRRVDAVRDLTFATLFSVGAAVVSGFAAVGSKVPARPEWANSPKVHLIVMEGISESLAGGVLGFALLSLTWMVMAVGHRRLARELPVG